MTKCLFKIKEASKIIRFEAMNAPITATIRIEVFRERKKNCLVSYWAERTVRLSQIFRLCFVLAQSIIDDFNKKGSCKRHLYLPQVQNLTAPPTQFSLFLQNKLILKDWGACFDAASNKGLPLLERMNQSFLIICLKVFARTLRKIDLR